MATATTPLMPAHLAGTELERIWNSIVALATAQNVDPTTQPVDASTIPAEELDGLAAVGAAEVTTSSEGKRTVTLKAAAPAPTEDLSGAKAASKPHTFAPPSA